jgi:CheY-like chemotaxis protein
MVGGCMKNVKRLVLIVIATIISGWAALLAPWLMIAVTPMIIAIITVVIFIVVSLGVKKNTKSILLRKKVVLVDDDRISLLVNTRVFQLMGFDVDAYDNPESALSKMNGKRFDVLIVDYIMPEIKGDAFLTKLDEQYGKSGFTKKPSVIMLTGYPKDIHFRPDRLQHLDYHGVINKNVLRPNSLKKVFSERLGLVA